MTDNQFTTVPHPVTPFFRDLTGQRFFRLTVLGYAGKLGRGQHHFWWCQCSCGTIQSVRQDHLGTRKESCGCRLTEILKERNTTHNMSYHPVYEIWCGIKKRCLNQRSSGYKHYGERGITICEGWLHFENFLADMGERPTRRHSVERLDNDGNYSCGHCAECRHRGWKSNGVWATQKHQCNNKRSNRFLTFGNERLTLTQWSRKLGINAATLRDRLKRGWSTSKVLTTPVRR